MYDKANMPLNSNGQSNGLLSSLSLSLSKAVQRMKRFY